ncbi:MAG: hypothetical protein LBQ03_00905 [Puniceicoccales bacterium]|jgi:hypothetical protein|nr:hypothetical protein [Puniceicoccales bacterium]
MGRGGNCFRLILAGGVIFGNISLEAGPRKCVNPKQGIVKGKMQSMGRGKVLRKKTNKPTFLKDPLTGTEYREIKNPKTKIEVIVEERNPDGKVLRWPKLFENAKVVSPNEAAKELLEEEDLRDEMKRSIEQAILKKSPKGLKTILRACRNPEAFIVQHPDLLREVCWWMDQVGAEKEFRETVFDSLKKFGYRR